MAVIVGTITGDRFILQHRSVDAGNTIERPGVLVTLAGQQVIFHCPGCGVSLLKFYAKDLERLRREDLVLNGQGFPPD